MFASLHRRLSVAPRVLSMCVRYHERPTKRPPTVYDYDIMQRRAQMNKPPPIVSEAPFHLQHAPMSVPSGNVDESSASFVVVRINGGQFKVSVGDIFMTDRARTEVGAPQRFDDVLMFGTRERTVIGRPVIAGCHVDAVCEEHTSTSKVLVFHKRRRKNSRKLRGHRSDVSVFRVTAIAAPSTV